MGSHTEKYQAIFNYAIVIVLVVLNVVVVVTVDTIVVVIVTGPRNLTLKFGQNWNSNSWDIVVFVVVVVDTETLPVWSIMRI